MDTIYVYFFLASAQLDINDEGASYCYMHGRIDWLSKL